MQALLNLLANIFVAGVILGLINAFVPMADSIKSLLNLVVLVVLVIFVLQYFGVINTIIPMFRIWR